jgi:hypothetical protein
MPAYKNTLSSLTINSQQNRRIKPVSHVYKCNAYIDGSTCPVLFKKKPLRNGITIYSRRNEKNIYTYRIFRKEK